MTGRTEPMVGDPELRTESCAGTLGHEVLIFDVDNHKAWAQSDNVVELDDML